MNKLEQLIAKCESTVSITVNQHRGFQSVEDYIKDFLHDDVMIDNDVIDEIGKDVYEEMIRTDTVIKIIAFPNTPIGTFNPKGCCIVLHYDINKALDIMLSGVNGDTSKIIQYS